MSSFDTIDHRLLLDLIGQRVQDKKFLRLIRSMLEAGYLEQWTYHRSYSGTPQGGVASPLLANVFLHELDQFMERKMASFDRGAKRRRNPEWKRPQGPVYRLCRRIDQLKDAPGSEEELLRLRTRLEQARRAQQQVPSMDPHDPTYRRLRYLPVRGRLCAENAEGGIDVEGDTDGSGAAREMKEAGPVWSGGPSRSPCRGRSQTTARCAGQEPGC